MKKKKIHVGCGTVYLKNFLNVDLHIPKLSFLAKDRPDLVKKNQTTVGKYYKNKVSRKDIETKKLHHKQIVVDVFGNALKLPFNNNSLDEVRSVQLFEHFTFPEGKQLLSHWKDLLKTSGTVHIDIPDLDETIKGYHTAKTQTDKDWHTRLLYGSHKNDFGIHKAMYSKTSISRLLESLDFTGINFLPNIHFYPAFAVEATK